VVVGQHSTTAKYSLISKKYKTMKHAMEKNTKFKETMFGSKLHPNLTVSAIFHIVFKKKIGKAV
jgi:hypothetical protein